MRKWILLLSAMLMLAIALGIGLAHRSRRARR